MLIMFDGQMLFAITMDIKDLFNRFFDYGAEIYTRQSRDLFQF